MSDQPGRYGFTVTLTAVELSLAQTSCRRRNEKSYWKTARKDANHASNPSNQREGEGARQEWEISVNLEERKHDRNLPPQLPTTAARKN
jgi:hypothetical protein